MVLKSVGSTQQRTIVFLESNFTGVDAIKKSAKAGFKCILITSDYQKMKSMLPYDIFDGFESSMEIIRVENSGDPDEIIKVISDLPYPVEAVTTFSQFRILVAAIVSKRLGLIGTNPDAIATALDKFGVRQRMDETSLPSIKYVSLSESRDVKEIIRKVGLPCIVKPSRGHSSLGVTLVRSEQELIKVMVKNNSGYATSDMIIEEYLEGPLFSLETITTAPGSHFSWGYTDRLLTDDFIEMGATFPALPQDFISGQELVYATLDAIGFDLGTCHTELIFTQQGPRIVEINPRPGGSGVCRLIEQATGRDVVMDTVGLYVGISPAINLNAHSPTTMRSILPPHSGRICRLPKREELLCLPGVIDAWFQRQEGDLTDDSRSNFSWLLTILAKGSPGRSSAENANAAADWALTKVLIEPTLTAEMAVI